MLPLYHGDDGLPTGVQLIGPPAREELLLALGAQLERALPWAGSVHASTAAIGRGVTPSARASAVPRAEISGTSSSSASSQVANAVGPPSSSTVLRIRRMSHIGTPTIRRRR